MRDVRILFEILNVAGIDVWCTTFNQAASTNDGLCQFCGAADHVEPTQTESTCTYPVELPDGSCDNDAVPGSVFCAPHAAMNARERVASDRMDGISSSPLADKIQAHRRRVEESSPSAFYGEY
jgi:hypothetical protein